MNKPPRIPIPAKLAKTLSKHLLGGKKFGEFELLKQLHSEGFEEFASSLDSLELFKTHFLLFHFLYQLQDEWLNLNIGYLEIHTLEIQLKSIPVKNSLNINNSLRDYYLNAEELSQTTQEDVEELIDSFWKKFSQQMSETEVMECLAVLELKEIPQTENQAKKHCKTLLQKHHPDKGGDMEQFINIQDASKRLLQHLKSL